MSEETKDAFLSEMKSYVAKSLITLFISVVLAGIAFYYTTKQDNALQEYKIEELQNNCAKATEIRIRLDNIDRSIQELKTEKK